jgi:hypothetical protein
MIDKQLITLVTQTVKDIAKVKGYSVYPKEHDVVMVLTALMIVSEALNKLEVKDARANRT